MSDRQQQPRSPLKAAAPHLQSPSFSPPVTTTKKKPMLKQPPESTTHNEIDNIVKLAYKQVKREREVIRKKLVTSVLKHSRDGVIHTILSRQRKSDTDNGIDITSAASSATNGKKRKHCNSSAMFDKSKSPGGSSPGGRKKKKRSSSSDMSITNGKNDELHNQSLSTQYKTKKPLVFPRLPSNNCPQSIHQHITFCQPYDNDQSATTKEDTKSQQPPPPVNLSTKQCKISIKSKNKLKPSDLQYDTTKSGTTSTTTSYNPLNITGSHPPLPKSSSLILLNSSFAVDDTPSLQYVPYFEDGDNEDIYSDLFDTKERERLYEFGPKYCEKETFESVDSVLTLLAKEEEGKEGEGSRRLLMDLDLYNAVVAKSNKEAVIVVDSDDDADDSDTTTEKKENGKTTDGKKKKTAPKKKIKQSDIEKLTRIHLVLSELASIDLNRVHERHAVCFFKTPDKPVSGQRYSDKSSCYEEDEAKVDNNAKKNEVPSAASSSSDTNSDSKEAAVPPYESIMDSYRDLLCRRCFTYDCNIHGNLPKANLRLLGELAVQKELDGHWKEVSMNFVLSCYDDTSLVYKSISNLSCALYPYSTVGQGYQFRQDHEKQWQVKRGYEDCRAYTCSTIDM